MPVLPAFLLALPLAPCNPPQTPPAHGPVAPDKQDKKPGRVENLVKLPEDFVQFARLPGGMRSPRIGVGPADLAVLCLGAGGELLLLRSADEGRGFTPGLRVSAEGESVLLVAGEHQGSVDVGLDGSAHVAWIAGGEPPELRYARIAPDATSVAPLDLGAPVGLCSSAAVTVDALGQVYVFYGAAASAEVTGKRVWLRRSPDGVEFAEPVPIDREDTDVSGLSAIAAHVDEVMGTVFVLYRAAYPPKPDAVSLFRGMRLISSENRGDEWDSSWVDNWKGVRDPRSLASLSQEASTTLALWDSGGRVQWTLIRRQLNKANLPMEPRIEGPPVDCFAPAGAAGGSEVCMAWLERAKDDHQAPSRLAWRVWQREGRVPLGGGYAEGSAGSATPAVIARKGRGFTILY